MNEEKKTADYLMKKFGVYHGPTDKRVAGFDTEEDAKADAAGRNVKALDLGIEARYIAKE